MIGFGYRRPAPKSHARGKASATQLPTPAPRKPIEFERGPGADYHAALQAMIDAANGKARMQAFNLARSRGQGEVTASAYQLYHGVMQVCASL
jgi:hypothetical protein